MSPFCQLICQSTNMKNCKLNPKFWISAGSAPPKSWERVADSSGPAPFKPPSSGSTNDVVEASGTAKPGEVAPIVDRNVTTTNNTLTGPPRPWQNYGTSYGGKMLGFFPKCLSSIFLLSHCESHFLSRLWIKHVQFKLWFWHVWFARGPRRII